MKTLLIIRTILYSYGPVEVDIFEGFAVPGPNGLYFGFLVLGGVGFGSFFGGIGIGTVSFFGSSGGLPGVPVGGFGLLGRLP